MALGERIKQARKHAKLSQVELAKAVGVEQATISRLERGETRKSAYLPQIAAACGVQHTWLAMGKGTMLGTGVGEHQGDYNVGPGPAIMGKVPLISFSDAGGWGETIDPYTVGDAERWLDCPVPHGFGTYVLRVQGDSMLPRFHDGELIFVDPTVEPVHRSFVIARTTESNGTTFKQYMRDEQNRQWLKAYNPDWPDPPLPVGENVVIKGVVIFKGEPV